MKPDVAEIRSRIKMAAANNQEIIPPNITSKKANSGLTNFLGLCVILLSFASVWAIIQKNMSSKTQAVATQMNPLSSTEASITSQDNFKQDLNSSVLATNAKIEELAKKMEVWSNRTWLLGVAHNENMNLTRKIQQKQGVNDPGYIVFDENWKLNKVPTTMEMSEDQKRKLVETSDSK